MLNLDSVQVVWQPAARVTCEVWVGYTPFPYKGIHEGVMVQDLEEPLDVIQPPRADWGACDSPAVGAVQPRCHHCHAA